MAALLVYANTLAHPLVYDDRWVLARVQYAGRPGLWEQLFSHRGLTHLVHRLDHWIWGGWPAGMHATSLLLHGLASLLAAWAALALTRSRRAALICGLIFAVHPVHTEAVASIAYRKDILAAIFVLLALILWRASHRSPLRYAGALLCVLLGVASKEVAAIGVAPMLVLADLLPGSGRPERLTARARSAVLRALPIVVITVAATVLLAGNLVERFDEARIQQTIDPQMERYSQVLSASLAAVPGVSRLLIFPVTLSIDYPVPAATGLFSPRSLAGAAILALWILGVVTLFRRCAVAGFAAAWTLILYLPCSNIVPLTQFFVAERYLYTPSFGFCLLLALAALAALELFERRQDHSRRAAVLAAAGLLICAYGVRTVVRNADWASSHAIWSSAERAGMSTHRVHNNLGIALHGRGEFEAAIAQYRKTLELRPKDTTARFNLGNSCLALGRFDEAEQAYRETVSIEPTSYRGYYGLSVALSRLGRTDDALRSGLRAIELNPRYADAHFWVGVLLAQQGRSVESVPHFRQFVEARPDSFDGHKNLAAALAVQGELEQAAAHFSAALSIDPDSAGVHFNLGRVREVQGRLEEAAREFAAAIRLDGSLDAVDRLAWLHATAAQAGLRDPARAVALATRACEATRNENPRYLATLAVAQASAGDNAAAVRTARRSLALAESRGAAEVASAMRALLGRRVLSGQEGVQ